MIDIKATFEKYSDETGAFRLIPEQERLSNRPDLNAYLLLDKLVPGSIDMVAAAGHDEIFLQPDADLLAEVATEADILTLVRCGVIYNRGYDCLTMWV